MKGNESLFSRLGMIGFIMFLAAFSSAKKSLAESTAAYFMSFGITDEQIETFRKEMLIGYGTPMELAKPDGDGWELMVRE